jgi:hypothetical protein
MGLHVLFSLKPCRHGYLACLIMLKYNRIQLLHVCKYVFTIEFEWVEKGFLANIIRI